MQEGQVTNYRRVTDPMLMGASVWLEAGAELLGGSKVGNFSTDAEQAET